MTLLWVWLAFNAGFFAGAWWASRPTEDPWAKHPDDMLHGEDVG